MNAAREAISDRGAACIAALFRGEDSEEADAGAFLIAEALFKWSRTPEVR